MALAPFLNDAADVVSRFIGALAPATLGAFVAQVHERGLGWRDRVLAMLSGILVSYYVTLGLGGWFGIDPFVSQAIGFVLAMIAHKTTPRLIEALSALVPDLIAGLRDRFLPRKDR